LHAFGEVSAHQLGQKGQHQGSGPALFRQLKGKPASRVVSVPMVMMGMPRKSKVLTTACLLSMGWSTPEKSTTRSSR
jgi:hypothetical protein